MSGEIEAVPLVSIEILIPFNDMLVMFYVVCLGDTVSREGGAFETNRTLSEQCL
jgi:hypothetical protein